MTTFFMATGLVLLAFFWQVTLSGIQRKVVAKIHMRVGSPWYQNFIDLFKAFSKSSISHGFIYDFGVLMALGGTIATLIFVPAGNIVVFKNLDNFFVIVYLLAVGSLGMAMSAVGSGNPWASIGVMRALTQMLGYELPYIMTVFGIIFANKTASISAIAAAQQGMGILGWNLFRMPLGTIVGFISLMGMLGKKPYDTPVAPAEIASGPLVEYGGKHLGMLMLQHDFATFVEVGLFVNLFLGGGTIVEFLIKYFVVYIFATMISSVVARFKIDQLVAFYYKVPLALAFIQTAIIIFTGLGVSIWL
ncbi:NADH dehydrogenase [Marinitoga sp. 1135]|uniref:Formate hydrogenlyase subunit 4 n=1 Tax=Marinitoga piezophila (strain DSM 14283 / JCM 11233 / KA3) TaxID=443254 RepID=H2J5S4_MARPK|nr:MULTISPECIES: NADH-quinone oxidoreductase subunit H [Marinitoga]AEX85060.1 formate hydrogenlyase subunit 4 [Marinitoga piezophila KA3]APT75568.1 NADH dehydrogenase [Marinitoga sp. 1137]NUU95277.1 NADH dehydrogenase [Marinitoga sp. 1135]NUU97211.1 NADH dehydrogenase [Marinitoga sp. 1138]